MRYPARITQEDNGTLTVTFPDIPEAITFGETRGEALRRAVDALETALSFYIDDRRALPRPSPARGRAIVNPSLQAQLKLQLYGAMRKAGFRKTDLARRMGVHAPQIDRLLDLTHASRLDQIESALAALGMRLELAVKKAA
jgi:antitoxin HicB